MSKEVMQQALNALEFVNKSEDDFMNSECSSLVLDAINVLKKALKQKNKVEINILQRQNAFLFKEKLSFEAEAKEWFNKYQEEAEECKKLYELNGILLQKCHTLEKMVEYKVDHIFDAPTNNKYVLIGYLKTLVDIDANGKETYIDEPFYTIAKDKK